MTMDGRSFDVAGSPPEQWDAIPLNAKAQDRRVRRLPRARRGARPAPRFPALPAPSAARDAGGRARATTYSEIKWHVLHAGAARVRVQGHAETGFQPSCPVWKSTSVSGA